MFLRGEDACDPPGQENCQAQQAVRSSALECLSIDSRHVSIEGEDPF